jgi:hypothetical protein
VAQAPDGQQSRARGLAFAPNMIWLITLTLVCFAVAHVCLWLRLVRQRPRWQVWLALLLLALVPRVGVAPPDAMCAAWASHGAGACCCMRFGLCCCSGCSGELAPP